MDVSKVVKKILLEAAGISFEVREWAKIIERYVEDYVDSEKKKLKDSNMKKKIFTALGSMSCTKETPNSLAKSM